MVRDPSEAAAMLLWSLTQLALSARGYGQTDMNSSQSQLIRGRSWRVCGRAFQVLGTV